MRGEGGVTKSKPCSLREGWGSAGGGGLTWHVGEEFATWSRFRVHAKCVREWASFIAVYVSLPEISGFLLDLPICRCVSEGSGCDMTRADKKGHHCSNTL